MFPVILDANILIDFLYGDAIRDLAAILGEHAHVAEWVVDRELKATPKHAHPCFLHDMLWVTKVELLAEEIPLYDTLITKLGQRHRGEAESLAIAHNRGLRFATRDTAALRAASDLGVPVASTIYLLTTAVQARLLSFERARFVANTMKENGRDFSAELLRR